MSVHFEKYYIFSYSCRMYCDFFSKVFRLSLLHQCFGMTKVVKCIQLKENKFKLNKFKNVFAIVIYVDLIAGCDLQ